MHITVYCKICGHKMQSAKSAAEAQRAVMEQVANHLITHPEQHGALAIHIALFTSWLLMHKHVRIPAEETALLESYNDAENCLLDLFETQPADMPAS